MDSLQKLYLLATAEDGGCEACRQCVEQGDEQSERDKIITRLALKHAAMSYAGSVTSRRLLRLKRRQTAEIVKQEYAETYGVGIVAGFFLSLFISWLAGQVFDWLMDRLFAGDAAVASCVNRIREGE